MLTSLILMIKKNSFIMRAYDLDLRKKVINFIIKGNSKKEASAILDISMSTIGDGV